MAQYTVPNTTTSIDGSTNYSHVNPGDTLILQPGTWSDLTISNLTGTAASPITIRNGNGQVVIDAAEFWLGIDIQGCEYVRMTGTGVASQTYGIVVQEFSNAGIYIRHITRNFTLDHVEIGPSSNPLTGPTSAGIRMVTYEDEVPVGWTQDNMTIDNIYIHDIYTEAMYLGKTDVLPTSAIIRNLIVSNCIVYRAGYGGIQVRRTNGGSIYNNYVRDSGDLVDAVHSGHAFSIGASAQNVEYYNNTAINCDRGFYALENLTNIRVHHNVFAHNGWHDVPLGHHGGVQVATDGNGIHFYNNTITESYDWGFRTKTGDANGTLSSNIIAESGGTDIISSYTLQSNCTFNTVAEVAFVDPVGYDYHLRAESPARASGYNGVDCGAFPYTGVVNRRRAFPSAEGAGTFAIGGRGTTIYKVTTLADSGAGSFREACEASGPRFVVFFVGGYIDLASEINVTNPYIAIYGQTAPGHGITLRGNRFRVQTHDVVCRYLRFAPGPSVSNPDDMQALLIEYGADDPSNPDRVPHDILFDHCTFRWATDTNVRLRNSNWNLYQPGNNSGISEVEFVTFQWCFFYECFDDVGSTNHSYNIEIGGGCTNISLHHNLLASCRARNPMIRGGTAEMINNLIFNCVMGTRFGGPPDQDGLNPAYVNYINNWEIHGNDTANNHLCLFSTTGSACSDPANEKPHLIYPSGNRGYFKVWPIGAEWDIMGCSTGNQSADTRWQTGTPHIIAGGRPVTIDSITAARTAILNHGGCKMPLCFGRDKADRRIVQAVKSHGGSIPSSTMAEVGGWPTLSPGYPLPADPDNDGIWSWFETANGSNPAVADADQYDYYGGGALRQPYMNIEVFGNVLGHIDPHVLVTVDVN